MILWYVPGTVKLLNFPRVGGGDPPVAVSVSNGDTFSPRRRG